MDIGPVYTCTTNSRGKGARELEGHQRIDIGRVHNSNSRVQGARESSKDTREWTLDSLHNTNSRGKEVESSKDTREWTLDSVHNTNSRAMS